MFAQKLRAGLALLAVSFDPPVHIKAILFIIEWDSIGGCGGFFSWCGGKFIQKGSLFL